MIRFDKFLEFARGQYRYDDHFPHVVLFKYLCKKFKLNKTDRIWLCLLYMAYYDDASSWQAFCEPQVRSRQSMPTIDYPISLQRRNLYGGRINQHLRALLNLPNLIEWIGLVTSWKELLGKLNAVYGNGRWASYTTAEMLVTVARLSIKPDTFEIAGSSGPRLGLGYLGLKGVEESAREVDQRLIGYGLKLPTEILESVLCNWTRMNRGRFYLGRNIDRQQSRILKTEKLIGRRIVTLWNARLRLFDSRTLGELNGWSGIDRKRERIYRDSYKILEPWDDR